MESEDTASGRGWPLMATAIGVSAALVATIFAAVVLSRPVSATTSTPPPAVAHLHFDSQPASGAPATGQTIKVSVQDSALATIGTNTDNITLGVSAGVPGIISCTNSAVTGHNTVAAVGGIATFSGCTFDHGGSMTLTASDGTITQASQTFVLTGPAALAFDVQPGGGTATANWSSQPAVKVVDSSGATVSGATPVISLAIKAGTGTVGAALKCSTTVIQATAVNGVASFANCSINKAGSYQLVATDAVDHLISPPSNPFAIAAGAAVKLVFTKQPGDGTAGALLGQQPVVTVEDNGGNVVTGNADTISLAVNSTNGAALTCPATAAVAGVATFAGCSVNKTGSGYTLTPSDTSVSGLTSVVSSTFSVTGGGAATLAFTNGTPGGGAGGVAFATQPAVKVQDAGGNPAAGLVTLSILSGTSGATLSCDANPTGASAGTATFSGCRIDRNGSYMLRATTGSVHADSATFTVAGSVANLAFTTSPGDAQGGSAFASQPVVSVLDAGGHPAGGAPTLSIAPGSGTPGATLTCTSNPVASDSSGNANFSGCSIDKAGTGYRLTATIGSSTATSGTFNVAVGSPAKLAFTPAPSGGAAAAPWGTQPVVTVEDAGGNRVSTSSSTITLTPTIGGGAGTLSCSSNAVAASFGRATFTACSIDKTGSYTLTATSGGMSTTSPSFSVTTGSPTKLTFTTQPNGGPAGTTWSSQPVVAIQDAGGNVVPSSATIALAVTPGTGTTGAALGCSSSTASGGVASFASCAINQAGGGYTLTASDGADHLAASSAPFSVTVGPPQPLDAVPSPLPLTQTFGGHAYAQNPSAVDDTVNSATGALEIQATDLTVAGIGTPFRMTRSYNSLDTTGGYLGRGWTSILDLSVTIAGSGSTATATVRGEDGQQVVFKSVGGGWSAPPGARLTLSCVGTSCTVTRSDGVRWDTRNGQLQDYLAASGAGLQFVYTNGLLSAVNAQSSTGPIPTAVTLDPVSHQVVRLRTPSGRSINYSYTNGLLTGFTDTRGKTWTYSYDPSGRLTGVTDPKHNLRNSATYAGGRVATAAQTGGPQRFDDLFSWNAATGTSTRSHLTNNNGALVRADYVDTYKSNALISRRLPSGATETMSYNAQLDLIEGQDPLGWTQQYVYSAANDLIAVSTPISSTTSAVVRFTYDVQHRMTSQTDADGHTTTYTYTGANLTQVTPPGPASGATTNTYNSLGQVTQVVTPTGKELFTYDAAGNLTGRRLLGPAGQPLNGLGTLTSYDEAGNKLTAYDPRGNTSPPTTAYQSTWTYDPAGNLLTSTTPGVGTTTTTYDDAGDALSLQAPSGPLVTYSWDEANQARTTKSGTTVTAVQGYDPAGNLITTTDAAQRVTKNVYDAAGRLVRTTDPANITQQYDYDIEGNVVSISDSTGNTNTRTYDSLRRLIRTVNNGAVSTMAYDAAGNTISSTDANGATTTTSYTPHNKVAGVTTAAGTTSYAYDLSDNLVTRTDANGHATLSTYDGAGRLVSQSVNGNTTTYRYDVAGNVISTTDPDGRTATQTFDVRNRVLSTKYSWPGRPGDGATVTYAYDAAGRRTQMADATGTHTYTYDAGGNLISAAGPTGTFGYDYSHAGQIRETYPDGTAITYSVDDAQNLMSVEVGTPTNGSTPASADHLKASYMRNTVRQTTGIAFSNGVLATQQYDASGNVVDQALQAFNAPLSDNSYTYDAVGNRLSQVTTAASTTRSTGFGYDALGRLTGFGTTSAASAHTAAVASVVSSAGSATPPPSAPVSPVPAPPAAVARTASVGAAPVQASPAYSYDGVGNRLTSASGQTFGYDAADRIVSSTGTGPWTYDRAGNVTADGRNTYTYDAADHLIGVGTANGTISYVYDGDGNRVSKSTGGATTTYVWDSFGQLPQLALEKAGTTVTRRYVYGDGPVAMQTPGAGTVTTDFYHLDPVGSVTALTDSSGAVAATYTYDAFGNVTTSGANPPSNPLLFQGQYLDATSGLYNMRARNYDPATGRFTQRDPISEPVGTPAVSPYVFVADRPTVRTDPSGQVSVTHEVFEGKVDQTANYENDAKLATIATKLSISAVNGLSKLLAPAVEVAVPAIEASLPAIEVGVEEAAKTEGMTAAKAGGAALAIIGIGLQTAITVEDCKYGSVQLCVADSVGLAINIGFTVGCAVLTEGAGAVACAIVGGILGIGLSEVISRYGPEIAAGIESVSIAAFDGLKVGAELAYQGLQAGATALVSGFNTAVGAISTGLNEAGAAISSGFNTAISTLSAAGYSAVQEAILLANTFKEGAAVAVATLVNLGYQIADVGKAVATLLNADINAAATFLKNNFNYTVDQVATALTSGYNAAAAAVAGALQSASYAVNEVATALKDVLLTVGNNVAALAGQILAGLGDTANQIGSAFQTVFALTDQLSAKILGGLTTLGGAIDFTVEQVAGALQSVFADGDVAAAEALKYANYAVTLVGEALKNVFNDAAQIAAGVLKTALYLVNDVATALSGAYFLAAQGAAQILENVSFLVSDVAGALNTVFLQGSQAVAQTLKDIGNTATQVMGALNTVFTTLGDQAIAKILDIASFVAGDVALALHSVFADADVAVAEALKFATYGFDQIATSLQAVFSLETVNQIGTILKNNLGATAAELAATLQNVFGEAAAAAAQLLKDIGYAVTDIGNALQTVFNQTEAQIASIFNTIGAAIADVAGYLQSAFSQGVSDVANLLSSNGWATSAIQSISSAFSSFGQSVANCFTSFFSNC